MGPEPTWSCLIDFILVLIAYNYWLVTSIGSGLTRRLHFQWTVPYEEADIRPTYPIEQS